MTPRAGTGTALRYRSQAQLEVQRATNLLRRQRQDRAAGLIPPPEDGPGPAAADENCTNEPCLGRVWHKVVAPGPCTGRARGVGDRNEPRAGARVPARSRPASS